MIGYSLFKMCWNVGFILSYVKVCKNNMLEICRGE